MTNYTQQTISLIQQAQAKEAEELDYESKLTHVKIADLARPKFHTRKLVESQLKVIIDSLIEYDFLGGIYVNVENNEVIDGWHRSQLWQQMGNETIPVHYLRFQSAKQEREVHLRLNSILAVFQPEDFGIHFANINTLDFGFAETEAKTYDDKVNASAPKTPHKTNDLEGYKKLTTTIKSDLFEKLNSFKKQMMVPHIAQVVENLIQFYENHQS